MNIRWHGDRATLIGSDGKMYVIGLGCEVHGGGYADIVITSISGSGALEGAVSYSDGDVGDAEYPLGGQPY
ncbi:MAG: hypothetical protein AB2L09_08405 [Coriobacteriia bacterium]